MGIVRNGINRQNIVRNGTTVGGVIVNGVNRLTGGLVPFAYEDAGVDFSVDTAGIVSLTFNDTYTYTATYDDGYDFMPITTADERENNISITVPPGYSNTGGDPVTGTETFTQEAVGLADITMTSITEGTLFTTSYRVLLTGTIGANPPLPITKAGFIVYEGNSLSPTVVRVNGEEIQQSDTTGEFTQTFSTQESLQTYSVVAYATNSLGRNTSSNVLQFTSPSIVPPFTKDSWNGTITVDKDGTVNVVRGNAADTDFPANVGTNDTCAVANATVTGTVEVPNDGNWSNAGEDIPVTRTPQQQPALPKYEFDSWNGSLSVTQAGIVSVTNTGNAAKVVINTTMPGSNDNVTPQPVDISITLTASSSYCNAGTEFTDDFEVEQPGTSSLDIVLTITPETLTLASGTTSASAKWTVTGNNVQETDIQVKSGQPTWITSIVNTTATPGTGDDNTIAITLQANSTISERSATVVWETTDEFATDNIVITQKVPVDNHATTGVLNPDANNRSQDIDLTFNTKRVTIPIRSNGDWVVSENVAGWALESFTGSNNGSVVMKGNNNVSSRERNGTITLKSTNGDTLDTIAFKQYYEGEDF